MINYSSRYASNPEAVKQYDTQQLRNEFLIDDLMKEDDISLTYSYYDHYIAGSTVLINNLKLETIDTLKAEYFLEIRKMCNEYILCVDGGILATIGKPSNE